MKLNNFFNRTIAASFYALFFLVPLVFTGDTSELFELNKMWLTWGLTIIIVLTWSTKMILQKRFYLQRTPLDIPIVLFLLSQIISTMFSLDPYVSFWGYYSRFNGGLLSTVTYIVLYYAFVSNLEKKHVLKLLQVTLFSGLVVALWGLPSHFGYDPTCFVFRGNFDVSCWTEAFQPKVRIFSTLGQPDWMAAYLAILIPLSLAFGIKKYHNIQISMQNKTKNLLLAGYYFALTALFYLDLIFTRARSGFIAVWVALIFFFGAYLWINKKKVLQKYIIVIFAGLLVITFFAGTPVTQLDKFTFAGMQEMFAKKEQPAPTKTTAPTVSAPAPIGELGGTDSGKIRLFVWQGALEAWKHYPIFGTGVETFAFAYYKFRPAGHNMTSEWEYLYNKAHNEYLNYLATTGIFGLGTYLAIILLFFYVAWRKLPKYKPDQYKHQQQMLAAREVIYWNKLIITALIAGFISILVSNFFGFSVVIINLYLFFIPAFVFRRENLLKPAKMIELPKQNEESAAKKETSPWQFVSIAVLVIVSGVMLVTLVIYWNADKSYAYGSNLDHAGYYQQANSYLRAAMQARPQEATFSDELSSNDVVLATGYAQKDATVAAQLAQEAIQLSNQNVADHPNNVVFWKTRVRIFYTLAQLNQNYAPEALNAMTKASELAPTDAKIMYNLGLLYSQTGSLDKGISVMQKTIDLKPDYKEAYYALGLFYRQQAIDKNGKVVNQDAEKNAVAQMHLILEHFDQADKSALDALKNWGEE